MLELEKLLGRCGRDCCENGHYDATLLALRTLQCEIVWISLGGKRREKSASSSVDALPRVPLLR